MRDPYLLLQYFKQNLSKNFHQLCLAQQVGEDRETRSRSNTVVDLDSPAPSEGGVQDAQDADEEVQINLSDYFFVHHDSGSSRKGLAPVCAIIVFNMFL